MVCLTWGFGLVGGFMSQIFLGGGCSLEEARSEWITETEFVPCEGDLQIQAKAWQQEHGGKKPLLLPYSGSYLSG